MCGPCTSRYRLEITSTYLLRSHNYWLLPLLEVFLHQKCCVQLHPLVLLGLERKLDSGNGLHLPLEKLLMRRHLAAVKHCFHQSTVPDAAPSRVSDPLVAEEIAAEVWCACDEVWLAETLFVDIPLLEAFGCCGGLLWLLLAWSTCGDMLLGAETLLVTTSLLMGFGGWPKAGASWAFWTLCNGPLPADVPRVPDALLTIFWGSSATEAALPGRVNSWVSAEDPTPPVDSAPPTALIAEEPRVPVCWLLLEDFTSNDWLLGCGGTGRQSGEPGWFNGIFLSVATWLGQLSLWFFIW